MITDLMRSKIEDLVTEFTRSEMVELRLFIQMANEVREMEDGVLFQLYQIIQDRGNPNRWNLMKLVLHELNLRQAKRAMGWAMANNSSDLPMWKDVFPNQTMDLDPGKSGTMVPVCTCQEQCRCHYRPTRPQPGDR